MIKFTVGGRTVGSKGFGDALMKAAVESVKAQLRARASAIRDPDTGEFPTVVILGDSLENLKLKVEGSPKLVALVRERLGLGADGEVGAPRAGTPPQVFLSYAFEDSALAERLAKALQSNGIDTFWAEWCIMTGESIRQRIDQGIGACTHFLVLLTPRSIGKPWVNQEIDAGLVRKLNAQCAFLPVRYELPASQLPPLLSGMLSPEIGADEDIRRLIDDIHGVTRKPPLGAPPPSVAQAVDAQTGYSPAATAIARVFVENTRNAMFADPQYDVDELARAAGLSVDNTKDGLHELGGLVKVTMDHVLVQDTLFAEFDRYWKPWTPADDAVKLAADLYNDTQFPHDPKDICTRYEWNARRLNPAIAYLLARDIIRDYKALGTAPFAMFRIQGKEDNLRRFVKSRS